MFKRFSKSLAVLGTLGVLALGVAFAQSESAPQPGMMGHSYGKGPKTRGMIPSQIDPQKAQAFCKEIKPQWQKIWQIKGELRDLWSKTPPDWAAIEKKEIEFIKTKLEIDKKAYEMGLPYGPKKGLRLRQVCGW
ncbi:MAG: hypothetical protein C0190_00310 [Thermodesulfobacterium geofontis]|uniref:Periplasmic heavy metal sensor n=1 Tax=Thermodesulfobacterium geofontis TaxID=1295609 RepID=A0A2N7PQI8_9BACT|nr:MAG: hypothetical protein C0190_00310 [Thermodesulfobacterium geofontis]PMP94031.1 MAG: hypothetical protein C0169_07050 [Thermodesulfobacterium geofontis]